MVDLGGRVVWVYIPTMIESTEHILQEQDLILEFDQCFLHISTCLNPSLCFKCGVLSPRFELCTSQGCLAGVVRFCVWWVLAFRATIFLQFVP